MKTEPGIDSADYTGEDVKSGLNRSEDIEERKNGYEMSNKEKHILSNIKEEEETEQQTWADLPHQVTSWLLKQPGVLIRQSDNSDNSVPVTSPPSSVSNKRDDGVRSPWRQPETTDQIERFRKQQPATSENGICAEASQSSPVIFPRNQNTEETLEVSQVFVCTLCPFVHMEEDKLHQHFEKVHPEEHSGSLNSEGNGAENPLPPSSTHQHPTPPKTLPTPKKSQTGIPVVHTCTDCGKSFKSKTLLTAHKRTHTGERPYQCSQCGKNFSKASVLKVHQRTHTGERPYHCSHCGKNFSHLTTLNVHLQTHTGERPYHCSQCGKSFSQLSNLRGHQRTHTGERPYLCSQCGKNFSHINNLTVHQRTHSGERPYHCSQCGKSFFQIGHLTVHQRSHTGERPFHCSECGKSFTSSSDLTKHQRTHTGERPYHCSQCGKNFYQIHHLTVHQRTHKGERPFQCTQCGKRFNQLHHLTVHQRTHAGERP
ncbi:hypothetical protein JZ751_016260 [Albula glossodonta]|uniref:C2H2-type domain-containing protein n=1 Tax=Albula glossodonta TaxID=121402 RepID=A0A8T2MVF6_9TELE|nr:hypothetical protein JZ751_016260 [Albula glossodonta]